MYDRTQEAGNMKRSFPVALIIFTLVVFGYGGGAQAQIENTYYAEHVKILVEDTDCLTENSTNISVVVTNNSVDDIKIIKLTCHVYQGCCQVDFSSVYFNFMKGLKSYSTIRKTILINKGCNQFDRLEFKVERIK